MKWIVSLIVATAAFWFPVPFEMPVWPLGSEIVIPGPSAKCSPGDLSYHGILFAKLDTDKDQWFFLRDGQKCWIKK